MKVRYVFSALAFGLTLGVLAWLVEPHLRKVQGVKPAAASPSASPPESLEPEIDLSGTETVRELIAPGGPLLPPPALDAPAVSVAIQLHPDDAPVSRSCDFCGEGDKKDPRWVFSLQMPGDQPFQLHTKCAKALVKRVRRLK